MRIDWFEQLTGFVETDYPFTKARLKVENERLHSSANGRSFAIGRLELVSLAELRERARAGSLPGRLRLGTVQGDVRRLHADPANAGALVQVASLQRR